MRTIKSNCTHHSSLGNHLFSVFRNVRLFRRASRVNIQADCTFQPLRYHQLCSLWFKHYIQRPQGVPQELEHCFPYTTFIHIVLFFFSNWKLVNQSYSIPTLFYCESFLQMLYSAFQLSSWKAPRAKSLIHFSPNRFNIARKINVSPPGFELPEFADSYVILMSNVKSKIKRDYSYQKFQTSSIEHGFNVKQYDWIVPTSLLQ